uniref:Uncharacterized protein n=1 Tax=Clastoptera arizonana TaxID=38151 RepID=A0A1B6CHE4_9HEMI
MKCTDYLFTCMYFLFFQSCDGNYGQDFSEENQSFEQNISRLDRTFKDQLVILLRSITCLGRDESVEKLCNILYREDFNNYYSDYLNDDDRLPSEVDSKSNIE